MCVQLYYVAATRLRKILIQNFSVFENDFELANVRYIKELTTYFALAPLCILVRLEL